MPNYVEKSRHGLYYLRLPTRLAHLSAGRRISLKTHSKRLAISRARSYICQIEQLMSPSMPLNPNGHEEFAFDEASRAFTKDLDEQNAQLDSILRRYASADGSGAIGLVIQERLRNIMVQQASALISDQIRSGCLAPGLTLNGQNQIFQNLAQYAENVPIESNGLRDSDGTISRVSLAKAQKSYKDVLYDKYLELSDAARAAPPPTVASVGEKQSAHTLLDVYSLWIEDFRRQKGEIIFSTEQEYKRHASFLTILSGHLPIEKMTKKYIKDLHYKTKDIKAYAATGKSHDLLTMEDLIPNDKEYQKITPETASGYSRRLSVLHSYAFDNNLTTVEPLEKDLPSFETYSATSERKLGYDEAVKKSYSIPELQAIFDGWIYRPTELHSNTAVFHYQFWMPLIAVFTGMRISEIAGLTTRDIEQREGIWCIKVEENESIGKRIKTISSRRLVPIHSKLEQIGFIDYVEARKKSKSVMLFDGVYFNQKNGWGHAPSTFFTRIPSPSSKGGGYFYKVGVHTSAHDGKDMHAFRHTLIDQLKNSGLSDDFIPYIVESISGHQKTNKTEADKYGDGLTLQQKAKYLEHAAYSGLNIDHVSYETFKKTYKTHLRRSLDKFNRTKQP